MIRVRASLRAATLAFAACLAGMALPAPAQLPTLGDGSDLTPAAERRIGERIARELYRDPDYVDDAVMADYVQDIWLRLLDAARDRGDLSLELDQRLAWQIVLGKDRSVNAFALPGGWMGLHMGLVAVTANRDELASVLAHEMSHVTQRHISRMVTQDRRQTPLMIGAMILGSLVSRNPDAINAVLVGSQAVAVQNQLNFSRDMEREADRVGYGVMVQAGFAPQGFAGMFEKLQQASRLNDTGNFPYLRTHPLTTERLADMRSRLPLGAPTAAPAPDLSHSLMAGRARVLSAEGTEALRALLLEAQALPASAAPVRQASSLYAATLAASRLREPALALRFFTRLAPLVAGDAQAARMARLLSAELALAAGDGARVLALVGEGRARPETLMAAQALTLAGRPAEAAQRLQAWVSLQPADATAWQQLAAAQAAQGYPLRSIRAEAEARAAWLDYGAALDRLRAAQDLARRGTTDHIEASIIDTRARQMESRVREQALER